MVDFRVEVPLLLGSRQRRFKTRFVPKAGPATVLTPLVEMRGLDDEAWHPAWLTHALLGQFAECVPIRLGRLSRDRQPGLDVRVVGRE